MTELMQEIAALRELTVPELASRYEQVFGKPPRVRHKVWLWKRIAWKLQEKRLGGLSNVAKARLETLIAQIDFPRGEPDRTPPPLARPRKDMPAPGTTLAREWRGQQVRVNVLANGYEANGVLHKSLTAAVQAITGSHWNPKVYFGLTTRRNAE